jgi:hypothetical protein
MVRGIVTSVARRDGAVQLGISLDDGTQLELQCSPESQAELLAACGAVHIDSVIT